MAALDVTEKAEAYGTLSALNTAFAGIQQHLQTMRQIGILSSKYARLFQGFTQELQSEINGELLEILGHVEERDWVRFGKVRQKWEKYLRGPEPKRRQATDRNSGK
jgi:hypothetical protein